MFTDGTRGTGAPGVLGMIWAELGIECQLEGACIVMRGRPGRRVRHDEGG